MADLKISQLTELTVPADDDVLPIVDTSATETKKIQKSNLGFIPSAYLDTDGALAANSDTKVASQKATKTYADTKAAKTTTITINGTAQDLSANRSWTITSGASFWTDVPGTPTRVSNTQFTITDTSNANAYDSLFSRGTVLKWTNSGTKQAVVVSSSYGANTVTVNIMGDILAAGFTSMKYASVKAKTLSFALVGTIGTGTDLAARYYSSMPLKVFGADAFHVTAGTTNATTYDVNKNGTTMFTTKVSVASGATSGTGFTSDDGSVTATGDYISIDCDSVSTTAPVDAYINVLVAPLNNIYLT